MCVCVCILNYVRPKCVCIYIYIYIYLFLRCLQCLKRLRPWVYDLFWPGLRGVSVTSRRCNHSARTSLVRRLRWAWSLGVGGMARGSRGGDGGAGSGSVSWVALSSSSESSLPLIGRSALARRWRDVRLRVEPFSNRTRYER